MTKPNLGKFANWKSQGRGIKNYYTGTVEDVKRRYRGLYQRLKAKAVEAIEELEVSDVVKQELINVVANLPHPMVVSIQDIDDVCEELVMGRLEDLYKSLGGEAREILSILRGIEEKEEKIERMTPPRPEEYTLENIGLMLAWSNEVQMYQLSRLEHVDDYSLKAKCPACASDLVIEIAANGKELHLRCMDSRNKGCKKEWAIRDISPTNP